MTAESTQTRQTLRLGDRIAAARRHRFVGRAAELELFRSAVHAPEPPFAVLHVHGPGGVGKSVLLGAFARTAREAGAAVIEVDGRNLEPSPAAFLTALGLPNEAPTTATVAGLGTAVLLIDTYETIAALDAWLRDAFLPLLPVGTLTVIAGRNPPPPAWRTDLGWRDLVQALPLRNLSPDESQVYLEAHGVPRIHHAAVLDFTHGHPLALALVADVLAHGDDRTTFLLERRPDIVRVLLERFVQQVPSQIHRDALQLCAHVRVTTEALLKETLGADLAQELFAWLRGLSFIEQGPQGLFPHDLARDVLEADLRWRNPEDYQELHRRVRNSIVRRLREAHGREQQRAAFDLLYLHRSNPVVRPIHDWDALATGYAEPATPADAPDILAMVHRHEGADSAAIAAHWLRRQPAAFTVCRGPGGEATGFVAALVDPPPTDDVLAADPAIAAAGAFARSHGPVRPGEDIVYHRFHMGNETYQNVSPAMNLMAMTCALHWVSNPRLAWSFLAVANPDDWHAVFTHLNLRRSPDAGFTVGGHAYAVYTHDWRAEPAPRWLELMAEREIATGGEPEPVSTEISAPLVVLSEPEFATAVRQALRDYARPDALAENPLLRSRLVAEATGNVVPTEALRAVVRTAAENLRANPRDEKLYRALHRTYFDPAATQELAAERLGLPFSSYRRHLTTGVSRITAALWQRELHGNPG